MIPRGAEDSVIRNPLEKESAEERLPDSSAGRNGIILDVWSEHSSITAKLLPPS